jgi:hypothetical protein
MPSPPCDRGTVLSTCENMSNTAPSSSAGNSDPVVHHRHADLGVLAHDGDLDVSAVIGVLGRVGEQVDEDLRETRCVAVEP